MHRQGVTAFSTRTSTTSESMSETIHTPVVISLPIEDRQTSFTFYRDGLDFDPIGEPAEDGIPEPL